MRYRVNTPQAIHQEIDGEVVLINLGTGMYYSLRGTAAAMWPLLGRGADDREIGDAVAAAHGAEAAAVAGDAARLAKELAEEGLLAEDAEAGPPGTLEVPQGDPYEAPALERFDDMRDLILLDPVHEVDETAGWPHPG